MIVKLFSFSSLVTIKEHQKGGWMDRLDQKGGEIIQFSFIQSMDRTDVDLFAVQK